MNFKINIFIHILILGLQYSCKNVNIKYENKSKETKKIEIKNDQFITYIVDIKTQNLKLFWKDDNDSIINNFENLKKYLAQKNQNLIFAMNAGMYKNDFSPQGLYIQEGEIFNQLDTSSGYGNFYLKPNGVFYISKDKIPNICCTDDFIFKNNINYATQSGPMLLIDGNIHPAFIKGSENLNIRNGVGILSDNKIIFAMSKNEINFYDFAVFFKRLGCKNALYLDGFVSRAYLPEENWIQTDGKFGVMIGVTVKNE